MMNSINQKLHIPRYIHYSRLLAYSLKSRIDINETP